MALKDPPDYVAIDPVLIYQVTDLPAETYQRLLQIIGWMYVTKYSGKPLGVKIPELAERWGVAERTAYHTLQTLGAKGYLTIHYSRGWTYLQRGPAIKDPNHMPSESATDTPHAGRAGHMPSESATATPHAARGGHMPSESATDTEHNPHATPLHETAPVRATPLHTTNTSILSVVVDHTFDPEMSQQQTDNTITAAVQRACMDAGFWPEVTAELCGDPWVTPERVTRTVDALQAKQARGERIGGKPIANVHALAVASLRGHREPVLQTVTMTHEERWGICPRCHSRPCECDEDGNPPWMADCE